MPSDASPPAEWEQVLSAAMRLQGLLPGAVLVGGTAAAVYARHRFSQDADHVLTDLRPRFDAILAELESVAGWKTARVQRPVQILGSLDGIETGVRQLIREQPLEVAEVEIAGGRLRLPTPGEMLRIKGVLILKRNATRDYVDFIALAEHLSGDATVAALGLFDELYPQPGETSALHQLTVQLAEPLPYDLDATNLSEYKNLDARWHDWSAIREAARNASLLIFEHILARR